MFRIICQGIGMIVLAAIVGVILITVLSIGWMFMIPIMLIAIPIAIGIIIGRCRSIR